MHAAGGSTSESKFLFWPFVLMSLPSSFNRSNKVQWHLNERLKLGKTLFVFILDEFVNNADFLIDFNDKLKLCKDAHVLKPNF